MTTMIFPMAAMVFYIWAIAVCMFLVRKKSVKNNRALAHYYKTFDTSLGTPDEFVLRMAQHYNNQLELPILFLITGLVCLFYGLNSRLVISLGWGFLFSRALHTYFHLGSNHILKRAAAFALGWFIIISLWGIIVAQAAGFDRRP